MYPMDKFSAIMWLNSLTAAQKGDKNEQMNLEAGDEMRQKRGYPTVEEEMQQITNPDSQQDQGTKPDWITDEQWAAVPSVGWWEDSRKRAQSIAQSKPVTPQEALEQTTRLRNSK